MRVSYYSTDLDMEEPQLQGILQPVSGQCVWYISRTHTRSNKYNFIIKIICYYFSVNTAGLRKWFDDNFLDEFPKLQRWIDAMMELPAVKETYVEPETYARYVSGYIAGNPEYDF